MALLRGDVFSDTLQVGTSVTVALPQRTEAQIGMEAGGGPGSADEPPPVLYLLHGLSDDDTAWSRFTSIERYATAAGLAVVMPAVGRSFYTDEWHGHRYWAYVADELPRIVGSFFRVSQAREDTFVAGLSMGGYGAMRLALTHPDRFAAAASLSGVLDVTQLGSAGQQAPFTPSDVDRVFGGAPGPEGDLRRALRAIPPGDLPRLHVSCGNQDHLVETNRRFVSAAQLHGADVTERFVPGEHEWGLWDAMIAEVVDWLPLRPPRSA